MPGKQKTFIIAEAGVNHNGKLSLAKELIDIAVEAKADAVKFQTFTAEEVVSEIAPQAEYQKKNTGINESQLDMIRKLELKPNDFVELYKYSQKRGIIFSSTAFDKANLKFLIEKCKIPFIKIPSGEITNAPFLYEIGKHRLPMILSTGMANLKEIEQALAVLAYGWSRKSEPKSLKDCINFYNESKNRKTIENQVTILHCVTEYPAPYSDTNLLAMQTIAERFNMPVGLSDHTLGIHIPIAAVAMGATMIEKHFTIDCNLPGPDHKASLNPSELKNMIKYIRDVESAMGDGQKKPQQSEIKNMAIARRSLVAAKNIKKGKICTKDNITCKRPGNGISAMKYWDYLGHIVSKNIQLNQIIN